MIVIDANLLLYAFDSQQAPHGKAREWLEDVLSGDEPVLIPWQSIYAFVRLSTDNRLPGRRLSTAEAIDIVQGWLALPVVRALGPGADHWQHFRQMLTGGQVRGPLAMDAVLAALTISAGGVLYSTDRDFVRFPGLRWKNPLV